VVRVILDVDLSGQKFLPLPLNLVTNWPAPLKNQ
jgi:hypothetical protein